MKKHRTDWQAVNKFWEQNDMTLEQALKKTKDIIREVDENLKYISPSAYINSKIKEQENIW